MECLLQKAIKDQTPTPNCNLEYVWYFHTECPDYIKKYDDPTVGKKFLKQQLYNMLALPYYNHRSKESHIPSTEEALPDFKKRNMYMEYPEVKQQRIGSVGANLLFDSQLRSSFAEGAEFKPDQGNE